MTSTQENSKTGHVFREGPFRPRKAYWINGGILHWRIGHDAGHCSITGIVRVQMSKPSRCNIEQRDGRIHQISDIYWFMWTPQERHRWGTFERRTATFTGFVETLLRRHRRF